MRLLIFILLVSCTSGCGGCVGDDSSNKDTPTRAAPAAAGTPTVRPQAIGFAPGVLRMNADDAGTSD